LEKAHALALKAGMKYVYLGNAAGHWAENTYCHTCKKMIIERRVYTLTSVNIIKSECKFCGEKIPGVWR
jgi:pyruvate formate lyase activating enzyme